MTLPIDSHGLKNPGLPLDGLSISARCQHLLLTSFAACRKLQHLDLVPPGWVLVGRGNFHGEKCRIRLHQSWFVGICWNLYHGSLGFAFQGPRPHGPKCWMRQKRIPFNQRSNQLWQIMGRKKHRTGHVWVEHVPWTFEHDLGWLRVLNLF